MNYRHHFHAGNFADLVKHAVLTEALALLQRDPGPLLVIDTHAGAGAYELDFRSMREGEAAAASRLGMDGDAPAVFDRLKRVIRDESARVQAPVYPGSPLLVLGMLRRQDRLVACELRADDHAALQRRLRRSPRAEAVLGDGYAEAVARAASAERALVLIDPPYERADDYRRGAATVAAVLRAAPAATVLLWAPLKDLDTLDRLSRDIEASGAPGFVAEARLRPPFDPMRLNGCAMLALNPPAGLDAAAQAACRWVAETLGEGGSARLRPFAAADVA